MNTLHNTWFRLLAVIVLIAVSFFVGQQYQKAQPVAVSPAPLIDQSNGLESCRMYGSYFVISQTFPESVGSNILVKHNVDLNIQPPCKYVVENGDFEIKNEDSNYIDTVIGKYAILDRGTGPSVRNILIYNLDTKTKVYESAKIGQVYAVGERTLSYDEMLTEEPTEQNCPKLSQYYSTVGGAVLTTKVQLTLGDTIQKQISGEKECQGTN